MALSFPRTDILTAAGFQQTSFTLPPNQRYSMTEGGSVLAEESTSAIWNCSYGTRPMKHEDAVTFEAKLRSLGGMINGFHAYDLRRPYPKAHANGVFNDTGTIHTIDSSNKAIRLENLDSGFQLSVGDYLAFNYGSSPTSRALHQVMEDITADGSGLTALFEIFPHIREGAIVTAPVILKKPTAIFTLTPENFEPSIDDVMFGRVSFKGVQYLP